MKKEQKNQAIHLRIGGGSYKEIANSLNISKGTLSLWFKNDSRLEEVKKALVQKSKIESSKRLIKLNDSRRAKLDGYYQEAENEAIKEFSTLKENRLFSTAISLYWGEGDRVFKNGITRISNVDGKMLKVFNSFLKEIGKINMEKIRAGVLIYPDIDYDKCLKYWSKETGIEESKFFKPTLIKGKHKENKSENGVCIVSVHDKYFKKKILVWLELFKQEY